MAIDSERIRFLYRNDQGRIDSVTWLRGVRTLTLILVPFALIWLFLAPYTDHDITTSPFFVPQTAAAYAFAILYAFAVLLVAALLAFFGSYIPAKVTLAIQPAILLRQKN